MSASSPRSITGYLLSLRASLAGADPALIQDALYDADEHLRSEAAANAGMSEADLLAHVVQTYGAPDEVAAAYRETDARVAAALRPPIPRRVESRSPLSRFFAVYLDPRAYASLFFMFVSLATGICYFTFAVTGLALSAGLAILIIGLPVFLAFIGLTRVISLAEGRLLEVVTGERMPRRPLRPSTEEGLVARCVAMVKDSRTWSTIVYFLVMLPLGIMYFTAAVTGISVGVSFLLVPPVGLSQRLGWVISDNTGPLLFTPEWIDTPGGWVFDVAFALVLLTGLMHLARGITRVHARVAKALLVEQA
jgi:hypothetical protein